ncbi:hypothetical protein C1H46_007389 [Malus baccata]|uniref:Uncharacterized protein n=1 Tax=Malus baccata TaxID=106549 RepID=A0A540N7L2_MALBA|nr:hypothetical protein C1H46_007389 [Malus baccata]
MDVEEKGVGRVDCSKLGLRRTAKSRFKRNAIVGLDGLRAPWLTDTDLES